MSRRVIGFRMKKETTEKDTIKIKPYKIFLALFLIVATWFYWFEVRPSRIKHSCSWVERYEEAKPEQLAMTEEELEEKGMLRDYK